MSTPLSRREWLAATISGAAALTIAGRAQTQKWNAGDVQHLLPTASHNRILLKASFTRRLAAPPSLWAGLLRTPGVPLDDDNQFYAFDFRGLQPEQTYELILKDVARRPLCDPWPITTFPSPDAQPKRFRLFVFTCAGGHPATWNPDTNRPYWVSIANRRKKQRPSGRKHVPASAPRKHDSLTVL